MNIDISDDLAVDCISKENALRVANNEYLRGFHNALCKALNETYSIHCDEGHFRVVQEETLTGLGMSMESALGPDAESFMNTLPSVTLQEPRKGRWIEIQLGNSGYCKCPFCHKEWDYCDNETQHFNYCPKCGADLKEE